MRSSCFARLPHSMLPVYLCRSREREVKHGSTSWLAFRPDAPAVSLHDGLGDGQSQSETFPAFVPASIIAIEDVGHLLRWDPDAGIRHRKADVVAIPCR